MQKLAKIVLDVPVNKSFDYSVTEKVVKLGSRVCVPFGKTKRMGVIIDLLPYCEEKQAYKVKSIERLIDHEPIITPEILKTCKWASSYYHHPIGQVVFAAITPLYRKENKQPRERIEAFRKIDPENLVLNNEQKEISGCLHRDRDKFQVNVIRGVTGSGKTELYIDLCKQILKEDKQILVMVPEINLIPQTLDRFKKYLGFEPVQYHSNLTAVQKYRVWKECKSDNKLIVIGTRSAIFLPFNNLSLIVVDEEHDSSYKQNESFRYNARDIGILRAKHFKCPVLLGSATPSFETINNIASKKYKEYRLTKRFHKSKQPLITIIDASIDQPIEGISRTLQVRMTETLRRKKKIILFLGRRGFSNSVICSNCKRITKCPKCDSYMTYHKSIERLVCHKCEFKQTFEQVKKCCEHPDLKPLGIGTQRIENKIKQLFPDNTILRVDSDTINSKKNLNEFINKANNGEVDVFIGTQMIVKGHDFRDVDLVGIINIDAGLYSTDFRGLEKTAQLITQVAGRSGRQQEQGNVFIQTYNPNHKLLKIILNQGYEKFSEIALDQRKNVNLPPFSHIALLQISSRNKSTTKSILVDLKQTYDSKYVFVYGPSQSKKLKNNSQHLYELLIGSNSSRVLSENISKIELYLANLKNKVNWNIDIDPMEL